VRVRSVHAGPGGQLAAVADNGDVVAWTAEAASVPRVVWAARRAAAAARTVSLGTRPSCPCDVLNRVPHVLQTVPACMHMHGNVCGTGVRHLAECVSHYYPA
jgi:hypothetical protein